MDEALIEQLNRVTFARLMPARRGAACEYGFDMSLVEDTLTKTPEERLEEHQRAVNMLLELNPNIRP